MNVLLLILGVLVLLFPNSFQLVTAIVMILIVVLSFIINNKICINDYLLFWWLTLSCFFIFYISISEINIQDKIELILKYTFFPFLWLAIGTYLKENYKEEYLIKALVIFSFVSFFLVLALYYLMLMGYNFVELFFKDPNIDNQYGLGFTLHVYGNMLFFAAGIIIIIPVLNSRLFEFFYVFMFIIVALISARTALLVSLSLGIIFLQLYYIYEKRYGMPLIYILILVLLFFGLSFYTSNYLNYNLIDYFQQGSLEKFKSFGGKERTAQSGLMIQKIINNPWGIGFNNIGIIMNEEKEYKYEVLILATLLRYGLLVFTLIGFSLLPIIKTIKNFRKINSYKMFWVLGFVFIIVFSFTNPYLESFFFQWMFFIPLVFLIDQK